MKRPLDLSPQVTLPSGGWRGEKARGKMPQRVEQYEATSYRDATVFWFATLRVRHFLPV